MPVAETNHAVCVVLTATVTVRQDMCMTMRTDPSVRIADYRQSLSRWLANPSVQMIVFVENSGSDLAAFVDLAKLHPHKQIEFHSFTCPDFPGSLGKGYGEMFCLKHALQKSVLLRQSEHFVKASGRYYLRNIDRLISFLGRHPELETVCNLKRNLTWADSRAFAGTVRFLEEYFLPLHSVIDDSHGVYFEHALARAAHRLMGDGGAWSMLPDAPEIQGVHATDNTTFRLNPVRAGGQRMLHWLRLRLLGDRIEAPGISRSHREN